ncbi:hypothetical protein D9613_009840 [Agrocybe pediades]|uniref:Uncharacterized protein n=1 Tax=Agrocybe pediades TaxID=84607 RepID=A0A8H4QY52_9AGAR|nr:hypothetical protein D9613_009840 [Agrocybe pediades]
MLGAVQTRTIRSMSIDIEAVKFRHLFWCGRAQMSAPGILCFTRSLLVSLNLGMAMPDFFANVDLNRPDPGLPDEISKIDVDASWVLNGVRPTVISTLKIDD